MQSSHRRCKGERRLEMRILMTTMMAVFTGMALAAQQPESVAAQSRPMPIRCVLVVQNHASGAVLPLESLADALTAKLSGTRFRIVNPANVIGVTQNRTAAGETMPEASATQLAQALGADALLTASVVELLDETTPLTHQYTIRMTLNLADAKNGATICGETVLRQSPKYTSEQVNRNSRKYLGDLLYAAADDCAEMLERKTPCDVFQIHVKTETIPHGKTSLPQVVGTTQKPLVLAPRKTVRAPRNDLPSMSELDAAVEELLARMQQEDLFIKNYSVAKAAANHQPIIVLGGLEDKTAIDGDSIKVRLDATLATLRVALFNTRLFEIKDDEASVALAKRIVAGGDSPLENGESMALLKTHDSPDFFVLGDLRRFVDNGESSYRMRLAVHSLASGKIVWEGIQQLAK